MIVVRTVFFMKGILQMKNYEEIRSALLSLCKKENLRFIEAELENEKICYARMEDRITLNKNYHKFKG